MSLPPDPHDDDIADPAAPPPPPPPPPGPHASPPPPPPPPPSGSPSPGPQAPPSAHTQADEADSGTAPAPPSSPAYAPRPRPTVAPVTADQAGRAGAETSVHDAAAANPPTPSRDPAPVGHGGRGRLGLMLAAVVAVIVVAGGVVVATGGDDEDDTSAPTSEQAPADEQPPADEGASGAAPEPGAAEANDSPVASAEAFFAAVSSSDCAGIVEMMTPESYGPDGETAQQAVDECERDATGTAAAAAADFGAIELVSEDGDEALISVTMTSGGEQTERELPLRRVDGEWKLHLDTSLAPAIG